ncbi:hypothetical protein BBP40_004163 [Aspergillus hancockii]|nr:hypothetical protein BBP40_004163 [Aspergillus hancockii]
MVELSIIKVFLDYDRFQSIPLDNSDISIPELATKANADASLLERFTKFLVAARVLTSPSPGRVAHTATSHRLADNRMKLLYQHVFDFFLVPAVHWPEYFGHHGLKEPPAANRIPYGLATGHPDKTLYEILETRPARNEESNRAMAAAVETMPITGIYEFAWIGDYAVAPGRETNRPIFVDVGGGKGQTLRAILQEYPSIPAGRCVLEDQPEVIQQAVQEAHEVLLP